MSPIALHPRAAAGRFPSSTVRSNDFRTSRLRSVGCLRRLSGPLRGRQQRRQRVRSRSMAGSPAPLPGSRPDRWRAGASARYRGWIPGHDSMRRWLPCRASARRRPCGRRACAHRCGGIRSRWRRLRRPGPGPWRRRAPAALSRGHARSRRGRTTASITETPRLTGPFRSVRGGRVDVTGRRITSTRRAGKGLKSACTWHGIGASPCIYTTDPA